MLTNLVKAMAAHPQRVQQLVETAAFLVVLMALVEGRLKLYVNACNQLRNAQSRA